MSAVAPSAPVSSRPGLRVAVLGCGLIGHKRSEALGSQDTLVGAFDVNAQRAAELVATHGGRACASAQELLGLSPDVVIVAAVHDQLAGLAEQALDAGAHVLVEKPAGISTAEIEVLQRAQAASGRLVKVGFNHRFHPALSDLAAEVQSGNHGELLHLRGAVRPWRPARI